MYNQVRFIMKSFKKIILLTFVSLTLFFSNVVFAETKLLGSKKYWKAYSTKINTIMDLNRRKFIKDASIVSAGVIAGVSGVSAANTAMSAQSYRRIIGSNDRLNVGIVGFSGRAKGSLIPAFQQHSKQQNCQIVGVSDIWNRRRDEGKASLEKTTGNKIVTWRNNEEMYDKNQIDAVIISTADFQHALHTVQAANAKKDVYVEKPFAETMEDARLGKKAANDAGIVLQVGSQRRSGKKLPRCR
jgi:hypothetical protein